MTITRIPVGGERPYEVVVGTGVLSELPGLIGGRQAGGRAADGQQASTVFVIHAGSVAQIAHPACRALADAGDRVVAEQVPDGEAAKRVPVAAGLWSRLAAERVGRTDCVCRHRRGRGDRSGRLRRGDLAARGPGRARPDDAAGHGRRGDRRQDRGRHPGRQEPRRRVLRPGRGAGRPGHAGDGAAGRLRGRAGRDHQGGLRRRPGHPGPGGGRPGGRHRPAREAHPGADRAGRPVQGARCGRGLPRGGPARDAELRPYPRPRDRAGRGVPVPARRRGRDRDGLRRRTEPAGGPPGRRDRGPAPPRAHRGRAAHRVPARRVAGTARRDGGG